MKAINDPTRKPPERRSMLARLLVATTVVVAAVTCGTVAAAPGEQAETESSAAIQVLPIQGQTYLLAGDGANVTAQVGDEGVLLVDAGIASRSQQLVATVESEFHKPIRLIVETSILPDHIGGAESVAKQGRRYDVPSGNPGNLIALLGTGAQVIAAPNVYNRLSFPTSHDYIHDDDAWPNDAYDGSRRLMMFNGEAIHILQQPNAITDGDSVVWFTGSNVVSTGDIFSTTSYPVLDLARGGGIQGEVAALNRLMYEITVPGPHEEGGTLLIPGHGRPCDQGDLSFYQEMVIIVRDRIERMIKKGMTLEQVKAARPTLDYDPRYGSTTGPWTTDMFIEAVYKSLKQAPQNFHY